MRAPEGKRHQARPGADGFVTVWWEVEKKLKMAEYCPSG
jgi:hypothetical protein